MFPPEYLPPTRPFPSGLAIPSGIINPSGIYLFDIFDTEEGMVCDTLLILSGNGFPHVFEGMNGTYFFTTPSGILFSEDDIDWSRVGSYASSITQIEESGITVLFQNNTSAKKSVVVSQKFPENASGWKVETTLSGLLVSDSAGSPDGIVSARLPILVGNNLRNVFPRIMRCSDTVSPITFGKSDAGIPQTEPTISIMTDLEAV